MIEMMVFWPNQLTSTLITGNDSTRLRGSDNVGPAHAHGGAATGIGMFVYTRALHNLTDLRDVAIMYGRL